MRTIVLSVFAGATSATLATLFVVGTAGAAETTPAQSVLEDWRADQRIDGTYTRQELEAARDDADATELEYSGFEAEIDRKLVDVKPATAPDDDDDGVPVVVWFAIALIALGAAAAAAREIRRRRARKM